MRIREYQEETKRTCPSLGSDKLDLCHMLLGIGSETEELYKAFVLKDNVNIGEEIADKFWYLANYCTFRSYDLSELFDNKDEFIQDEWELETEVEIIKFSKLQDYVKKYIAYNKPIDRSLEENSLKGLLWSLNYVIDKQNLDLEKLLENNINKLKVRFPDKFTQEKALNRDLISERIELEK